jgi:hypothetical protein
LAGAALSRFTGGFFFGKVPVGSPSAKAEGKAAQESRTAMSGVKLAEAFSFFILEASSSFLSGFGQPAQKRLPGAASQLLSARSCSTCYPCTAHNGTAPRDSCGHHQETSGPISKAGRVRPRAARGRAPFPIVAG